MMPIVPAARLPRLDVWRVSLVIVFLAALAVRLYGINWDDGADLHPDELFIAKIVLIDRIHFTWPPDPGQLLDPARSGLNPRSADPATGQFREFAYGALPLWVTDAVAWLLSRVTDRNWNAPDHAYLVGRALSAFLSALTVIAVALLGATAGSRAVGLTAALFAALAPMSIQLAHFFTTDSWLTFFVAVCLLATVSAASKGGASRFAVAGLMCGFALATKGSVFTLAAPLALAIGIDAARTANERPYGQLLRFAIGRGLVVAIAAAAGFLLFEPYALLQPAAYLQSLLTQADIASGRFDVPFSRVYVGTTPLLYQVEQFVRWGYGPISGLLALGGLVLLALLAMNRQITAVILIGWFVAYGTVILVSEMKFLRYLEPLAPVLSVAAGLAFTRLTAAIGASRGNLTSTAVSTGIVALTLFWTGAFVSVYAHENPRLAGTHWIFASVPPGSSITADYWDDGLPRTRNFAFSPRSFGLATITLDLYRDYPPAAASDEIYRDIRRADYIIQSSRRIEAAVRAAPWRYPVQARYFDELARGTFGFVPVASFVRAPALAGVRIDDSRADESFVNYDHPAVTIYQRAAPLPRRVYDLAMGWALQRPWSPTRHAPPRPSLLLDQPVGENPSVADSRWSAQLTSATPVAIVVWVAFLGVLLAIGLPMARALFPMFPDHGWGLSRTLAIVVCAYPLWLLASLNLVRFRAVWVISSLLAIGFVAWRLWRDKRNTARTSLLDSSGIWRHSEAAFWVVFLLFLAFRLLTPDSWHPLWGGEKPMEFAQLNAIGRSAYFPPYDPWFADGYMNYYYYGLYLVAFILKATGIPSEIGFNLALPTVMGLLASGGFAVAAALARGLARSARLAVAGGWAGVVALCLIGNLSAARGLLLGRDVSFDPFLQWTWAGSRAIDNAITEFPYFSGLYADLHAHVVALPITVLAIALAYAIASARPRFGAESWATRIQRSGPFLARLACLALVIGTLSATNFWDVPVYALLGVAALFMASSTIEAWTRRLACFVALSAAMVGGAALLFLPFHQHFVALFGQVALVRDPTEPAQFLTHLGGFLVVVAAGLCVLLLSGTRSGSAVMPLPLFAAIVVVAGLLLSLRASSELLSSLGILLIIAAIALPPFVAALDLAFQIRPQRSGDAAVVFLALAAGLAVAIAGLVLERVVFGTLVLLAVSAFSGWLCLRPRAARFVCLLLTAATATAAGVELIVVADDLIGTPAYRMNTVFKFYNQIWVLLAISAASLVALMIGVFLRRAIQSGNRLEHRAGVRAAWAGAGVVLAVLVLLAGLTYPAMATKPRLEQRFVPGSPSGTLNALDWMAEGEVPVFASAEATGIQFAGDAAAIAWLNQHVTGTPVIAEASIGPYRCNGSRISAATGLPTIIGWERHEQQQRYLEDLPPRVRDVQTLYTSSDVAEKETILRRYNVEYVIVGDLERLYPIANNECTPTGSAEGFAAFDDMVGDTLEIAHSENGTTIYRVLPLTAS